GIVSASKFLLEEVCLRCASMSVEASPDKGPDPEKISVPGIAATANQQIHLVANVPHADIASNRAVSIGVPFVDFVGRCFLRACLWMELLESWKRETQALPDAGIESA